MEQVRVDKVKGQAGVWLEVQAEVWAAEAVSQQAPEGTVYVRNAEKRPFIKQERPAIIKCAPNAAQP
jgi:hypothetical protein